MVTGDGVETAEPVSVMELLISAWLLSALAIMFSFTFEALPEQPVVVNLPPLPLGQIGRELGVVATSLEYSSVELTVEGATLPKGPGELNGTNSLGS